MKYKGKGIKRTGGLLRGEGTTLKKRAAFLCVKGEAPRKKCEIRFDFQKK